MAETPSRPRLIESIYRVSLEPPGLWWLFFGPGLEREQPYLNIGAVRSFLDGYREALRAQGVVDEWDDFLVWLRDEAGAHPPEGWPRALLARHGGNHEAAIQALFALLHEYLLQRRPAWFLEFNRRPQPSLFQDGRGAALADDVRTPEHVALVAPQAPPDALAVRVSAFNLTDGYVMHPGLPEGFRQWRTTDSQHFGLGAAGGASAWGTSTLPAEGVHVALSGTSLRCQGGAGYGALWIRGGVLLARATAEATWSVAAQDRLLLLSPPLFAHALTLPLGPLPGSLATAEPLAWAQAVDAHVPRIAVLLELRSA